jgi:hypothetical protein
VQQKLGPREALADISRLLAEGRSKGQLRATLRQTIIMCETFLRLWPDDVAVSGVLEMKGLAQAALERADMRRASQAMH